MSAIRNLLLHLTLTPPVDEIELVPAALSFAAAGETKTLDVVTEAHWVIDGPIDEPLSVTPSTLEFDSIAGEETVVISAGENWSIM